VKEYRATKPHAFVTSARVEVVGAHERLSLWIKGAFVGSVTLGAGQGATLAWVLGLQEAVASTSEPPPEGTTPALEWARRSNAGGPFADLAMAVQRLELEKATWVWRCDHGNALRDLVGTYEPVCGCRARTRASDVAPAPASVQLQDVARQLHAELARDVVGNVESDHVDGQRCEVCELLVTCLRNALVTYLRDARGA
jgi:hypothetical protein